MVRETRHLWVGNLPDNIREDRIREHFKRYGRVQSVKLLPRGGKEEACEMACTVAFMDIKSASKAHTAEHKLDDRTLTTEYYEPAAIPSSSSPPNASAGYATTSPSNTRFPNGHSTAEEHGNFTERFYDRTNNTRVPENEYIRRTGYHEANRARTRDRNFRNGPYNSLVERHRTVNNSWTFDGTATNRYNNQTNDTGYNTTSTDVSDRRSEQSTKKKTKSRSGSRTPSPSGSASSRSPSRSRSRSSSSSTSSSVSRETSSTGSPKSRRLQSNNSSHQPVVHSEDRRPLAICVRNLPLRSSDTSLKDGLFHEYKKHGKVTWVKVVGQSAERHAIVCFKKPEDVEKALEVSYDKLFFGCKIEVAPYQGFDVEDVDLRPYEAEIDEFHPKATRTLFIGNLEKDVTASDLRKHFDQFGEIIEIDIKKQGAVSSYAFCQYSDIVSVVKAIRTMDGEHLNNNRIKLGFGKSMPTPCVWVDGVSDSVTDKYLSIQFDPFGIVGPTFIDREKGQALIFFDQVINAQTAVNKMRGVNLRGRKIQVDFASRECQEAFFENLEKQGLSFERPGFEERRDSTTRNFETLSASRFSRYDTPTRPRTASYSSRTGAPAGQVNATAIPSPGTPGSVTPRGAGSRSRLTRYEYYDQNSTVVDYAERTLRSYDEYSQGSAASQEDVYDHEYVYHESPSHLEVLESRLQAGDHVILPFAQPDIKNLQKERVLLLEQLEECHSSGDELIGPKKRFKLDHLDGTVTSDVIIEANRDHRKVMEVRRSSDASLKHLSRRPSIDGKHVGHERGGSYLPHAVCKRRKTAGSDSGKVHHYESSESVSGSRPGTPLCDERPENFAPSEPRRIPREREGPLTLPLPRFASQLMGRASVSVAGIKGQKENILASPPAAVTSPRISNPKPPSPTPVPPPASPPPRPPSLSSNSSDSDGASPTPSLDERIKSLDERYEKWSGSRALSTAGIDALAKLDMSRDRFKFRHKLLDLDLKEVQPSEIVKSVMAKRSVFDEDSKRLENVGEKYEPKDFNLYPRTPVTVQTTVPATTLSTLPLLKVCTNLLPKTPTMLSPRSSGTSLTPAKGLQYPFPTHPPMQQSPSSSGTCTTPTPPSQPPTSTTPRSTHGENRLKSCANASSDNWTPSKVNVNRSVSSSVVTNKPSDANKNIPPVAECASPALQSDTKPKTIKITRRDSSSSESKSRRNSETGRRPEESEICDNTEVDRLEKVRLENEKIEKENAEREKAEKEKQERERAERERLEKERDEKERQEKLEKERLEKERLEKERKEREERERRERDEKERREREEKELREKEQREKEERERQERERREKEDREKRERGERERQERERREREEKERRERAEREKREREEQLERERLEKERRERRDKEEKDRKEREERERRDREEMEKEKRREKDDERKHKDDNHDKRSEYRHRDNHSENKTDIKNAKDDKNSDKKDNHISRKENRYEGDKRKENNLHDKTKNLFNEIRETKDRPIIENHHVAVEVERKLDIKDIARKKERSNSISGPVGIKRRLSSHESLDSCDDSAKKIKLSQEHKKISERRDSKDTNKSKHKNSTSCKIPDDGKPRTNHVNDEKRREKDREERHKNKHNKQKIKSKNRERDSTSVPKSPPKDMEFLARLDLVEVEKQKQRSKEFKEMKEAEFKRLEERKKEILLKDKDDGNKSGDEQRKQKRERIKKFSNSSDNTDSDEPKKHSIFDIVDDEPAYISMYDKVKARSCKNMQKQEEEKRQEKIKAKFSQLKQSRAKREDKKRSTSWDEDSDSDDRGEKSERHRKNKMLIVSSDEDDDGNLSHRVKKEMLTDSDSDRNRTIIKSEIVESSDDDHIKTMRKFKSRITSDSSDDEFRKIQNKIKSEMISDNDDQGFADCEEKYKTLNDYEDKYINKKERKNSNKSDLTQQIFGDSNSPDIKEDKFVTNRRYDNSSADENMKVEVRKKHKKKQKRQKNSLSSEESSKFESDSIQNDGDKVKLEKKKQHSKKDKKRDKSKDEKQRKSKKNKSETKDLFRRDGKMENIFGSLSDDSETHRDENNEMKNTFLNRFNSEENNSRLYASDSDSPMQDKKICEENERRKSEERERAKAEEKERIMKEEHRKRKEKKRREKEKRLREEQINNEHSVDYCDLGKQLEDNIKDLSNEIQEPKLKTDADKMHEIDDTFKFNDVEDLKKDDRKEIKEKKKKRKKSKDEKQRHHHHHHHHDKNKLKSPEIKKEDDIKTEPFDVVEKLDKETTPNLDLSLSPQTREPMISPIPKTPTSSKEKKRDKFIPGFGVEIDEKVHDNAVKSISEFDAPKIEIQVNHVKEEIVKEEKTEIVEEKPRVIISQEETEDAVAALLGESFGSGQFSDCYNEPQSPEQTNVSEENVQDDEEMRQAVQSLNSSELEIKPDTPQSENDLQIDTDTEEQEEVAVKYEAPRTPEMIDFSQPPKTPDIPSYFRKESQDRSMPNIGSPPSLTPIKPPPVASDVKRTLDLDMKKIETTTRTVITQWSEKKEPTGSLERIPSLAIQPNIAAKLAPSSIIKTEENMDNLPPLKPVNKPMVTISMHNMPAQMPYPVLSQKDSPHLPKVSTTNVSTISRLPITPVMVSKPLTPTTLLLPQAKVAHARLELPKDNPPRMIYQQYPAYSQPRMIVQRPPGLIITNRPSTPTSAYLQPSSYNIDSAKLLTGSFSSTEPPKLVSMPQTVQPIQTSQAPSIIISTHGTTTTPSAIKPFMAVIQEAPKLVSLSSSVQQPSIIQSTPKPTIANCVTTNPLIITSTNTGRSSSSPLTLTTTTTAAPSPSSINMVISAKVLVTTSSVVTPTNVLTSTSVLTPTKVLTSTNVFTPTSVLTPTNVITTTKVSTSSSILTSTNVVTSTNIVTSMNIVTTAVSFTSTNTLTSTNISTSTNMVGPTKGLTSANALVPTNIPTYVQTSRNIPPSMSFPTTTTNVIAPTIIPSPVNNMTSTKVVISPNAITSTSTVTQTANIVTQCKPPTLIITKPENVVETGSVLKVSNAVRTSTPSPVIVSAPKAEEPEIPAKPAEPSAIQKVTEELNFSLKKLDECNKVETPTPVPEIKSVKAEAPIENQIETTIKNTLEDQKIDLQLNTKLEPQIKNKIDSPIQTNIEQIKEEVKIPEDNKLQIKSEQENVSVIKETEKFDEEKADTESVISDISKEPLSNDVKEDGIDSKEDSDYWSAKEVNIDSVIKKVDALCSADELSDRSSEVGKDDWLEDKTTKVEEKEEEKHEIIEASEGETIVEDKSISIRGRKAGRARGRKTRGGALSGGMQTRRGKVINEVPATRGARGGRVGRPKSDRNVSKSESDDVYEFKDDSDECQNKDRPRLILTIKSPSVTGANGNTAIVKEVVKEIAKEMPPTPPQSTVQAHVPTPIIQPPQTPPKIEKVDNKEEFASPANTRKSRRLQERDVSRNTVDDTIEDVVKNTVLTRAAAAAAAGRRVTRQTPTKELNRKSPRGAAAKKKDRRASETTDDSSEEKFIKSDLVNKVENVEVPEVNKEIPNEIKAEVKEKPIEGFKAAVLRRVKGDLIHEPMTLIDPVTGLLTPMRECEEGRYIPLSSQNANHQAGAPRMVVSKPKSQEITQTTSVITPQIPPVIKQKPQSLKAHVLAKASQQVTISTVASPVTTAFVPKTITQSINVNVSLPNYTPAHLSPKLPIGVAKPIQGVKVIQPPLSPNLAHQQKIIQQTKGVVPKSLIVTQVTNSALAPQMAHMKQVVQTPQLNKVPLMKPHIITQQLVSGNPMKQHIITGSNPQIINKNMEPPKVEVSIASGCVMVPRSNASPQNQQRHILQPGLPVSSYESALHGERRRSPPPAHQNSPSPQAEGISHFSPGAVPLRPPHDISAHYVHPSHVMYQQYFRQQPYHLPRSPIIGIEKSSDGQEGEEAPVTSPPLELRRPGSVGLALTARPNVVPHSLQSPHDRVTNSPQVGQVFSVRSRRLPYSQGRYYESNEPPPAHRPLTSHSSLAALGSERPLSHITTLGTPDRPLSTHSALAGHIGGLGTPERPLSTHMPERPLSTHLPDRPLSTHIPDRGMTSLGLSAVLGAAGNIMGAVARHVGADAPALQRGLQAATPPHASQVPPQAESLLMLLKQYPLMWQGLLALKNDQAAVQMYFVSGNDSVAKMSLPKNSDGTTPPLRIFQRMRLEPPQVEGVARKMQMENEHCMLLALPCGHDHIDVLKQSTNLENGFITYLQQKHAAGIVNVAAPGTSQPPAYVVHIFPTCDFVNENLRRIAPSLLERVADIAHLLIVITTV